VERLDGITVLGYRPLFPWGAKRLFRQCDAEIYHSCEPSFGSYLALKAMPGRKHMVTFRDPRDRRDWQLEYALPSLSKLQVLHNYYYENNLLVRRSMRRVHAAYVAARFLVPKVRALYRLREDPRFLPTPVAVPERAAKAAAPTACYVARFDRRKRPTLFLDLAAQFPDVTFIAMGKSRDKRWERELRRRYGSIPNLELAGFVDQFATDRHCDVLGKSWIMVNTATREALPNAFLEAAAHRCAILSHVNPDGFASEFGYHARADDFAQGLRFLLADDRWKDRGERGHAHVKETFELEHAVDLHEQAYEHLAAPAKTGLAAPCGVE
jgi:glycosyltransferase involved in cell wall biosynthesis